MFILLMLFFSFACGSAYAHTGRTDSDGGHHNWQNGGEYHYHHGYPAHDHTNGVCPYDFVDNTRHEEGGGGGESKFVTASTPVPNQSAKIEETESFFDKYGAAIAWGGIIGGGVLGHHIYVVDKERKKRVAAQKEWERRCKEFREKYEGKSLAEVVNAPAEFRTGKPIVISVYGNWNTKKYHRCTCRYAKQGAPINIINTGTLSPCSICRPMSCPDWYREYLRLESNAKKYGVNVLP